MIYKSEEQMQKDFDQSNLSESIEMAKETRYMNKLIKELLSQVWQSAQEAKVDSLRKAIEKELLTLWTFGKYEAVGGLYSDEKMRGPNVETATMVKLEDVLFFLTQLK